MSFTEILVIAIVAVLFLGPDKLPKAMVEIAKFLRSFKGSINEAKTSFEQEIKIQELKEEGKKYKKELEAEGEKLRKKLTFEELDELKKSKEDINKSIEAFKDEVSLDKPKKKKEDKK